MTGRAIGAAPVFVRHDAGEYPVFVEPGMSERLGDIARRYLPGRRLFAIADSTVARIHGERIVSALTADSPSGATVPLLTFPPGERSKTRQTWALLSDRLAALGAGRDSAVVAIGGGVTGDLAGFVAATYHRGVPVLQVPTTLVAMVDSAIGGKTGLDTPSGKNVVGAFHQPAAVVADPALLPTLDQGDYRGGLAEAVKHGLMLDAEYFAWIEAEAPLLGARDLERTVMLVGRSVELKAAVVTSDARDSGRRAVLNAGHTVAHAIERASNYSVAHGDAVAIGLAAEALLAAELAVLDPSVPPRLAALLRRLGLPTRIGPGSEAVEGALSALSPAAIVRAAAGDKKNRGGGELWFALPAAVGRAHSAGGEWAVGVDPALLAKVLERHAAPGARPPSSQLPTRMP